MRSSGICFCSPAVVPMAISSAYWLWNRSWEYAPRPNRIVADGMFPVAGSFMSFQMPARPDCTWAAFSSPHQVRPSSVTKSGKAVLPGQTWPR